MCTMMDILAGTTVRERPVDFIANIIETLSLQNVTKDSVTVGLCASGVMG